jgi:ketol-acid reductoisomerase
MDWMYTNCSTTAQRGALDWKDKFKRAVEPVFKDLYEMVRNGSETARVLATNSRKDYKEQLEKELSEMRNSEMWRVGKIVRSFRTKKIINDYV